MEHDPSVWEDSLKMAILNSYVQFPDGSEHNGHFMNFNDM